MPEAAQMQLTDFVKQRVGTLIDNVIKEAGRTEHDTSEDGVHDLRVAIRRLSENLKVFADLFPKGNVKMVRSDLKVAMQLAGEVRNHDIATELMRKAEITVSTDIVDARVNAAQKLSGVLAGWNHGVNFRAWKEQLHV